jgi:hypothetical protein
VTLAEWWAVTRWEIAQDTGWTLDAIEELSFEDVWEYLSLRDASARVRGKD